ncbi:helix-turn-helix domain containing protein [Vagococcus carniphilus]|uniref:helix-turn-helix domain containing protein n=1 Tax=Vagococcus carniphilus TaxID=218144 RepID=UPI00288CD9E1|nr:helix-turn-helix domain containing protein [Vagococcus carniphilus]MDT2814124.1 helix-turn-helix domain containing protein [Vagococcus carniphilus]MDT2863852.1 helix-turn-helix domain containing protein [Vagococcus carniphilus]
MRKLLDTPTQRRLKILEHLNEVSDWISSNELAKENNASLRTINNDVSYLKENWYPHLIIETSKKNGVRLRTQPSSHVQMVYRYVLKTSEAFRLLESMFFDTTLSIEKWGEKLYISESSLYRITGSMSKCLKNYGLILEKKPCRIVGKSEFYARFFYTSFFREAYNMTEWPFPTNKRESIAFIEKMLNLLGFKLDDHQINQINVMFNVTLIRQSQGFFLEEDKIFGTLDPKIFKLFSEHSNLLDPIAQQYKIKVTDKMIHDLVLTIFLHNNNWKSDEEKLLITKEINNFIKTLRNVFDLKLSNSVSDKMESKMKHLYLYHQLYPFRNFVIFDQYLYDGMVIKERFPMLNKVVEHGLGEMEKNTNFPWKTSFHYVILYWIMMKWGDLPTILESKKEKAKILIMSNLGLEHSEFLTKQIKSNFEAKIEISKYEGRILFLDEVPNSAFKEYDLLITNFNTDLLPNDKLVVVDDIPSNANWGTIRRSIDNIHKINPDILNYLKTD